MRHRIELDNQETDIDVVLPGGQLIQLQFRTASPSIAICLPTECGVTNWTYLELKQVMRVFDDPGNPQGDDMEPAKVVGDKDHVRFAKQIVVDLNPAWVTRPM